MHIERVGILEMAPVSMECLPFKYVKHNGAPAIAAALILTLTDSAALRVLDGVYECGQIRRLKHEFAWRNIHQRIRRKGEKSASERPVSEAQVPSYLIASLTEIAKYCQADQVEYSWGVRGYRPNEMVIVIISRTGSIQHPSQWLRAVGDVVFRARREASQA